MKKVFTINEAILTSLTYLQKQNRREERERERKNNFEDGNNSDPISQHEGNRITLFSSF